MNIWVFLGRAGYVAECADEFGGQLGDPSISEVPTFFSLPQRQIDVKERERERFIWIASPAEVYRDERRGHAKV